MLQQIQWEREALARYEDFMRRHFGAATDGKTAP
jgi:hypothetical protein